MFYLFYTERVQRNALSCGALWAEFSKATILNKGEAVSYLGPESKVLIGGNTFIRPAGFASQCAAASLIGVLRSSLVRVGVRLLRR